MRRFVIIVALILALSPMAAHSREVPSMIQLSAHCAGGVPCRFNGERLEIELVVRNAGAAPVPFPVDYYLDRGPVLKLVDNHSGKERSLSRGPSNLALMEKMQALQPGQSIRIPCEIFPADIERFALRPIDVNAVLSVTPTPSLPAAQLQMHSVQLRIVDARSEAARP
ncbi:hypothetical protein D7Y61_01775 [Stenotrophomonas maltophilia]|nr:hypothetical protein [Stenotrophomonas maltophilia]